MQIPWESDENPKGILRGILRRSPKGILRGMLRGIPRGTPKGILRESQPDPWRILPKIVAILVFLWETYVV